MATIISKGETPTQIRITTALTESTHALLEEYAKLTGAARAQILEQALIRLFEQETDKQWKKIIKSHKQEF